MIQKFDIVEMENGGLALVLEPNSEWAQFPSFAKKWASKLKAKILSDPIISCDECLLEVEISGGTFWISYDDFQSNVQLEPQEVSFNKIVLELQKRLRDEL